MILCSSCHTPYPDQGVPYRCPLCGGVYDIEAISYQPVKFKDKGLPGIWRYRRLFGLPENAPVTSLGEGNTPLVWTEVFGHRVAFKCEFQNPTGSFKDRGTSTLVSFIHSRNVIQAAEDSSGNAGASFAAYAAHTGIQASIFIPETASGPKRRQIEAYGAKVVIVPGSRSDVTEMVQRIAVETGITYASHAYLPFNLPGYATIAYEIVEQLGRDPGTVICPAGQGGLLLGAAQGFTALKNAGVLHKYPRLIGVQARVCAPLWELFQFGTAGFKTAQDGKTIAEGVRVRFPVRAQTVIQAVLSSQGEFYTVEEPEILNGRDQLAQRGFYVETTSAIVWSALAQMLASSVTAQMPEPIVVVLTGSGLKTA
jgi:threonine synthase